MPAAAGVLDGLSATTHRAFSDRLAECHPRVDVDPDALFVRAGRIATSAGVTAGIDLALALVEDDHGADVAQACARHLVVHLRWPSASGRAPGT